MKSFEAMSLCIGRDAELMADVLGRKPITIRRWKQDPMQSGARNPVDSLEMLMQTALDLGRDRSEAFAPLDYLVGRFDSRDRPQVSSSLHSAFADMALEFSHLTMEYSAAIRDGKVTPDERRRLQREAAHIRERLDDLDRVLNTVERGEG